MEALELKSKAVKWCISYKKDKTDKKYWDYGTMLVINFLITL